MSQGNPVRMFRSHIGLTAIALMAANILLFSSGALAQGRSGGKVTPSGAKQPETASFVTPFRTYSCGTGYTFIRFDISDGGNIVGMQSGIGPVGQTEVINTGVTRTGYEVCYNHPTFGPTSGHDLEESGTVLMGAPSVFSGCVGSRFPCEITRLGPFSEIRVLRRITGNSFVGPAPAGGTFDTDNFNGVGCDTLGECSNCTNRTLHVITRVTNLTGVTLTSVQYQEIIDFDMRGETGSGGEIMTRTSGAMTAVSGGDEDDRKGALLQSLIINPLTDAYFFGDTPLGCDATFGETTPTLASDYEARVLQFHGSLGAGGNTGNNFRIHLRGF